MGCKTAEPEIKRVAYEIPYQIAVLPFYGEEPYGEELTNAIVDHLVNAGFCVIERSSLPQIIQEQKFQYTGRVDPVSSVQMGKITGVDFLVMGSVKTRSSITLAAWLWGDGQPVERIDLVQARWVSVQSGRIVASLSYKNIRDGNIDDMARIITSEFQQKASTAALTKARRDYDEQVDKEWSDRAFFRAAVR